MKIYVAEVNAGYDYDGRPLTDDEILGAFPTPERAQEAINTFLKFAGESPVEWKEEWSESKPEPATGKTGYRFIAGKVKQTENSVYDFCYVMEFAL